MDQSEAKLALRKTAYQAVEAENGVNVEKSRSNSGAGDADVKKEYKDDANPAASSREAFDWQRPSTAVNMRYKVTSPVDWTKALDWSVLKGKSALVTGGSSGMGAAFVEALAEGGASVTVADLDKQGGIALRERLKARGLRNIQIIETDVTSFESQATAFKAAYDVFNGLDIVIPCAGLMGQSLLDDIRISGEELPSAPVRPSMAVLNVNLTGVYFSTALALHYFALDARKGAENGSKHLLLISSAMAYMPAPLHSAYDASKWGVRGLWKSLKDDNQERTSWFRTNLIAPTLTRTPMTEAFCEFLAAKGFEVCQPSDIIRAGMRLICDETIVGRAVLPLPGGEAADLCDDFEGFDGGRESLRILESGKVGEGPKELGMFRIG